MKPNDRAIITNSVIQAIPFKTLSTAIKNYQAGGSPVYASGLPEVQWNAGLYIPVPAGTSRTYLDVGQSIRQKGLATGLKIWVFDASGAAWAFRIFRYNNATTNYDCVASRTFTPANANSTQTFTFTPAIPVIEGDIPAIFIPPGNYNRVNTGTPIGQNPFPKYVDGNIDLGQSDAFAAAITDYHLQMQVLTSRPYIAFLGDSIIQSGNGIVVNDCWHTDQENIAAAHTPGGTPGNINLSIPYRFSLRMPANLRYQSFGKSGNKFSDCVAANATLANLVACTPKVVIIHCGVNDVAAGRTWPQISADLDTIRAALPGGTRVLIDEILPYQGDDAHAATVRSFNTSLAAYATANSWTLVVCHDEMGQNRPATGFNDDLAAAYSNGDSVHLSLAGVDKMSQIWRRYF